MSLKPSDYLKPLEDEDVAVIIDSNNLPLKDLVEEVTEETKPYETTKLSPYLHNLYFPDYPIHIPGSSDTALNLRIMLHKNVRSKDDEDAGYVASVDKNKIRIIAPNPIGDRDVPKSLIEGFNGSEVILRISKNDLHIFDLTKKRAIKYRGKNIDLEILCRRIQGFLREKNIVVTKVASSHTNGEQIFLIQAESFHPIKKTMLTKCIVDVVIKGTPNDFGLTFVIQWEENKALDTAAGLSLKFTMIPGMEFAPAIITGFSQGILETNLLKQINSETDLLNNTASTSKSIQNPQ